MNRSQVLRIVPAAILLAACDIPTTVPEWDMTWNVPVKGATIGVGSFLPGGVTLSADSSTFRFSPNNVTVIRTLALDCSQCAVANGLTVPKPAFTATGSGFVSLPSGLTGAMVTQSALVVTITNGFNFDPIRPGVTAEGFIIIRVRSGLSELGRDSIPSRGPTGVALPANGGSVTRTIPLEGPVTGTGNILVTATLNSPEGDNVLIDATRTITFTATPGVVQISSATINLNNRTVNTSERLDLSAVDDAIAGRVLGGRLFLTIANPFAVQGGLMFTLVGGGLPIEMRANIPRAATATETFTLTGEELRRVLGSDATLMIDGIVSGTNVAVAPSDGVEVTARMELNISTRSVR